LTELELYGRCSLRHPNCHHLRNELVKVEGMDMPEVEGMDMVEQQDNSMNHRWGRKYEYGG
jgi:hypothetical protein